MLYAFKLGPIDTGEGSTTAFIALTPEEALPPIMGGRASDALRAFAEQAEGHDLRCEPSLARAAQSTGFVSGKVPDWALEARASLAFGLGLGSAAPPPNPAVGRFLAATAAFMNAAPWRHWGNEDALELHVSGLREKEYEVSVMGAGGQEFGLALYEQKGAIRRLAKLADAGRMREAAGFAVIAVTMTDEPRWAITALREAFGLEHLPEPMKVARGRVGPVDPIDLATLTVALGAITDLSPARPEIAVELRLDDAGDDQQGLAIAARARAPKRAKAKPMRAILRTERE
jgi:hypothetical protein